jgi:hypothetical protein
MKYTSLLRLATAFVAFTVSSHAAEVFKVTTIGTSFPITTPANVNVYAGDDSSTTGPVQVDGVDYLITAADVTAGIVTIVSGDSAVVYIVSDTAVEGDVLEAVERGDFVANQYGNPPDIGDGSGMTVTDNFNGDSSVVNTGDQGIVTNNSVDPPTITHRTTYFGPKYYAGVNRQSWNTSGTVSHSNGNGYRIRSNNVNASVIANNGGPVNTKAIFMFDADTSSLSGANDYLIFNDTDTLTAKLSVPGSLGPNWTGNNGTASRVSLATYRAMVKAKGPNDVTAQYYVGTLYTVDLAALPNSSTVFNMSETGASATWTLMPNIEVDSGNALGETNLTVDTSESATTVPGKFLTNITQVGFLLETDTNENTGGYNFGVREFIANASSPSAAHPSGIEWSEDFTSPVNGTGTFLTYYSNKVYDPAPVFDADGNLTNDADGDPVNVLTGSNHAYKWAMNGAGLTATFDADGNLTKPASTVTQENNQIVLDVKSQGNGGDVNIRMVGPGTDNARRVRPPSHEVTFEIDLIEWKAGQADLVLQTRGHDGYVRSVISPSGNVKYTTWGSALNNYQHTNFDDINSPSSLTDVVIVSGGTVADSASVDVEISGNAEGTVVLNADSSAVESVTLSGDLTGYTAEPTLTWTGMSADPTVSFNFSNSVANTSRQNVVQQSMRDIDQDGTLDLPGTLLNDGQVLTYIQSYDNSDDSISFYYSLDGSAPQFITKLTAADHSPNGNGFFSISTGTKWGQPNNQDAVWITYKKWGTGTNADGDLHTAKLGINSITVATSDDDRDGVINRNDALPNNPLESVDSDSDGVGDNSDAHPGYNDSVISAGITQAVWDASQTALTTAQSDLTTAQGDLTIAQNDLTAKQTELDNAREARPGSTVIDVANDVATITLTVEQTSDVSDWSSGTSSDYDIQLSAPAGASFYRFTIPE